MSAVKDTIIAGFAQMCAAAPECVFTAYLTLKDGQETKFDKFLRGTIQHGAQTVDGQLLNDATCTGRAVPDDAQTAIGVSAMWGAQIRLVDSNQVETKLRVLQAAEICQGALWRFILGSPEKVT